MRHNYFHKRKRIKSDYIFKQEDINKVMFNMPKMSEVIGEFISLRRGGIDYVGRCPFCRTFTDNDKHFRVSDRKGLYKCFECGAGGTNSISFLMRYFNLSFGDVLLFACRNYTDVKITPYRIRSRESYIDDGLPF